MKNLTTALPVVFLFCTIVFANAVEQTSLGELFPREGGGPPVIFENNHKNTTAFLESKLPVILTVAQPKNLDSEGSLWLAGSFIDDSRSVKENIDNKATYHRVEKGESIESIATIYGAESEAIFEKNSSILKNRSIIEGDELSIPDNEIWKQVIAAAASPHVNLDALFIFPTAGWNWGIIHGKNAVDIANDCGTNIYSAHSGTVIDVGSPNLWNGGYGGYILIKHDIPGVGHYVFTRYAHTQSNIATKGRIIKKGELIAIMGNSGYVHGPTGCHLHFEVLGAKNILRQ